MTVVPTTASSRLLSRGALTEDLDPLPLAEDTVRTGAPRAGYRPLLEGGYEVGVWELTPGTVTDVEIDEVFVVVAGAGSVTFADGSRVDLAPGVVVRLVAGDATTWHIVETVRKVVVSSPARHLIITADIYRPVAPEQRRGVQGTTG